MRCDFQPGGSRTSAPRRREWTSGAHRCTALKRERGHQALGEADPVQGERMHEIVFEQ